MYKKRPLIWLVGVILALAMLYTATLAYGLCFFIVTQSHSLGGEIEFAGKSRSLLAGNGIIIMPVFVTSDSEFVLQCNGATKRDGYITRGLDLLVYVNIQYCEIASYRPFG